MKLSPELADSLPKAETPARLVGSPRQIGWAETIRQQMLDKVSRATAGLGEGWAGQVEVYSVLLAADDASWFIANKDKEFWEMNWDWLGLTPEQRQERKQAHYRASGRPSGRTKGIQEDTEDTPAPQAKRREQAQAYLVSFRQSINGKVKIANALTTRNPVDWLTGVLERGDDVALVNAWAISPEQYTALARKLP